MPEKESSPLKAVISWAGGIAAAVITAVLIAHFTTPSKKDDTKGNPVTLDINGYIIDSASHAAVRNATIKLTLGSLSAHQRTDATGKYRIILSEPVAEAAMTDVAITAPGYQTFQNTMAVTPPTTYAEILIDAISPAPPTAQNDTAPAPAHIDPVGPLHKAQILIKPLPTNFVKAAPVLMLKH